ncbi:MAG: phage virion morphogenesis protein [Magnetovibrionaceae bacterium]
MTATETFQLDAKEFDALGISLGAITKRLKDATPMFDEIGAAMVSSTQFNFEAGQAPDGTPWKPSERVETFGGQTLVNKGHLRDSLTHEASPDQVSVGSNLVYAGIHNFGGEIRPKNGKALRFGGGNNTRIVAKVTMPQRQYLGVGTGDEEEIGAIVQDYLTGGLN